MERRDIGFVGDAGGTVFDRGVFFHDDLRCLGRVGVSKLTVIGVIGKDGGGTDTGILSRGANTHGVKTKAVSGRESPDS